MGEFVLCLCRILSRCDNYEYWRQLVCFLESSIRCVQSAICVPIHHDAIWRACVISTTSIETLLTSSIGHSYSCAICDERLNSKAGLLFGMLSEKQIASLASQWAFVESKLETSDRHLSLKYALQRSFYVTVSGACDV